MTDQEEVNDLQSDIETLETRVGNLAIIVSVLSAVLIVVVLLSALWYHKHMESCVIN